jgi:hypothetical protein
MVPASRRIRERLTELGLDYLAHQVPVDKERRTALRRASGSDTVPALLLEDGTFTIGETRSAPTWTSGSSSLPRRREEQVAGTTRRQLIERP